MNNKEVGSSGNSPLVPVAALVIIFAGVIYAKSIITPFFLALFISIICAQPIAWLENRKIPRLAAFLIVLAGLILIFTGFIFLIGGTLSSFSSNVGEYETTLTTMGNSVIQYLNEQGLKIPENLLSGIIQPAKILSITANAVNGLLNVMGKTFLVFLIILFILMEFGSFMVKARAMVSGTGRSIDYFYTIAKNIRQYLWIKTLVAISVGILIYIALLIIGIDYPLLWALIAALMNYIPNIGSIIASIPAFVFALVQVGIGGAMWTLAAFMVIYNVVGNFIEPRIMGKGLGLSTLVVFLSLLFWGLIFGTVGMILSVPITMAIKIILEQNEKTRWLAILLGTPDEAKNYLEESERKV
ncbi:MAG: AI-2E family transporter [Bacteroidia bacterium]|nr:AI-2E family transporter [Bacteroidia bacterium]